MLVRIRLFARLREIAGGAELQRTVDDGATVGAVWDRLAAEFPGLTAYATAVSCAVNEDHARLTATLKDGDEVAFLPPVSGGEPVSGTVYSLPVARWARRAKGAPAGTGAGLGAPRVTAQGGPGVEVPRCRNVR